MNKLIIIGAGLVMIVVLSVFLTWPQYQKFQAVNLNIQNKQLELQSKEAYFAKIKDTSSKLQQYPDALAKISTALPKDPSLASLASFLQINAAQTGLVLKKIVLGTAAPSENKGPLTNTKLTIQVSGSYEAFKDFLGIIESSARVIEVQRIAAEMPSEESEEAPLFTLDLKTASY